MLPVQRYTGIKVSCEQKPDNWFFVVFTLRYWYLNSFFVVMSMLQLYICYIFYCIQSLQTKEVIHFHYTTWPDFNVPKSPRAFLNFLFAVRSSGALERDVGPPVIHCSAGIGRSGTFCLVDTCLILVSSWWLCGNSAFFRHSSEKFL